MDFMTGFWSWTQTTFGATVVGGLVVLVVVAIASAIWRRLWQISRTLPSAMKRSMKRADSSAPAGENGLRTTPAEPDEDVKQEMPAVRWLLSQGAAGVNFSLYNIGTATAKDVLVTSPHRGIEVSEDAEWRSIDGNIVVDFGGRIVDAEFGRQLGSNLSVAWTDAEGSRHVELVPLKPFWSNDR